MCKSSQTVKSDNKEICKNAKTLFNNLKASELIDDNNFILSWQLCENLTEVEFQITVVFSQHFEGIIPLSSYFFYYIWGLVVLAEILGDIILLFSYLLILAHGVNISSCFLQFKLWIYLLWDLTSAQLKTREEVPPKMFCICSLPFKCFKVDHQSQTLFFFKFW